MEAGADGEGDINRDVARRGDLEGAVAMSGFELHLSHPCPTRRGCGRDVAPMQQTDGDKLC